MLPVGFSDHFMVIGTVFINGVKPTSAYWHFNTELLNDGHFRQCFRYLWSTWKLEKAKYSSLQQWWDIGKIQIQQSVICNFVISTLLTSLETPTDQSKI